MSGAELFKDWIKRSDFGTYTAAADYLGLDKSIVTKLANGARRPGRDNAVKLEQQTGIPVAAWGSDASDSSRGGTRRNGRKRKTDKASNDHAKR